MNDNILFKNLFEKNKQYKGFFFIIGFHTQLKSFLVGIKKHNEVVQIGEFSSGLEQNERDILIKAIEENQKQIKNHIISVDPGICVELNFQGLEKNHLVKAIFNSFQFEVHWEECTWNHLILNNLPLKNDVKFTSPDKIIWKNPIINKEGYLAYLAQISSNMLPFLENKLLTTIRYPHGIPGESFFQKNNPDYAPDFINTVEQEGNNYIVCNDLSTLLWLGNQLAIEFHIPFQTFNSDLPNEIVFDLDPPNKDAFHLAIKAAKEMRQIFESFHIKSYPKVSGSKGIQIHLPIKSNSLSYDDTRIFTSFIANYLIEKYPEDFTIERFKKNRGNRLYIDYVQHAKGKTIICPYSARGKDEATVATPLYWDEVVDDLTMDTFTIPYVLNRLSKEACPMSDYFEQENSYLIEVISKIKEI